MNDGLRADGALACEGGALRLIQAHDREGHCVWGPYQRKSHPQMVRVLSLMARPRRFERPTPAFGGQYSIQLSYGRVQGESLTGLLQ